MNWLGVLAAAVVLVPGVCGFVSWLLYFRHGTFVTEPDGRRKFVHRRELEQMFRK